MIRKRVMVFSPEEIQKEILDRAEKSLSFLENAFNVRFEHFSRLPEPSYVLGKIDPTKDVLKIQLRGFNNLADSYDKGEQISDESVGSEILVIVDRYLMVAKKRKLWSEMTPREKWDTKNLEQGMIAFQKLCIEERRIPFIRYEGELNEKAEDYNPQGFEKKIKALEGAILQAVLQKEYSVGEGIAVEHKSGNAKTNDYIQKKDEFDLEIFDEAVLDSRLLDGIAKPK